MLCIFRGKILAYISDYFSLYLKNSFYAFENIFGLSTYGLKGEKSWQNLLMKPKHEQEY